MATQKKTNRVAVINYTVTRSIEKSCIAHRLGTKLHPRNFSNMTGLDALACGTVVEKANKIPISNTTNSISASYSVIWA